MENRAYSVLEIKAVSDDERIIEGIASTPSPDRAGDVVEPMGAKFSLPMPLLWQHNHGEPVGFVEYAEPTAKGIKFRARIVKVDEPGELKNLVDRAWQSVKSQLVRGVSIGFKALKYKMLDDGSGIRFSEWSWLELSLVTIPANAEATISRIKSIDHDLLSASGQKKAVPDTKPAALGKSATVKSQKGSKMTRKTFAERISAFEATLAAKSVEMTEIMDAADEEGRTLDTEEKDAYDALNQEVGEIREHVKRLNLLQQDAAKSAKPVDDTRSVAKDVRNGVPAQVKKTLPKGTGFTRMAMALAASGGSKLEAIEIAKRWENSTPEVVGALKASLSGAVEKAAMTAGTTTDADWAAPLVEYQNMASEFIELLRPQTIIGQIQGLRRVPFNVKMPTQTQGSTINWVGENSPKPVGEMKFGTLSLGMTKAAGIIVLTEELVRSSSPSAEDLVRSDMIAQMAQFLDSQFLDPAKAEVADVSPASITNGATSVEATGTDAAALRADVQTLYKVFLNANLTPAGGVWFMSPTVALTLGMMQNALGQPEFPGINMNGGTFFGLPVITSTNIARTPEVTGTTPLPAGDRIVLARASDILVADDDGVNIDVSREASVQMVDNPVTGATQLVSLWQNNLVGLRAERFINWKRRRPEAVAYIDRANYVA